MRKLTILALIIGAAVCMLSGCQKKVNYLSYVSEKRTDIYLYSNDGLEIKIYKSEKENPYCSDGIKGEMNELTEIYVTLPKNCDELNISVAETEGEMNFLAVQNCYYLSFTGGNIQGDSVDVTLTYDGESQAYSAVSVLYDGVISCDEAVNCIIDYDTDLFASLTENNIFLGEIYVRLLYDDGCFYYVGVCDRNKLVHAYLVDGEHGKIIATKELNG